MRKAVLLPAWTVPAVWNSARLTPQSALYTVRKHEGWYTPRGTLVSSNSIGDLTVTVACSRSAGSTSATRPMKRVTAPITGWPQSAMNARARFNVAPSKPPPAMKGSTDSPSTVSFRPAVKVTLRVSTSMPRTARTPVRLISGPLAE
ncbi:hypothetical protein D3C81_1822690 [compost metagenome]